MNTAAVATILEELNAAGEELRSCAAKLDESDAVRAVLASGLKAYQAKGAEGWTVAPSLPAGFIGWEIQRNSMSATGTAKFWRQNGGYYTREPIPAHPLDAAFAASVYADKARYEAAFNRTGSY